MENKKELALEINNLCVEFRTSEETVYALNGMDIEIEKGTVLGLVGETGAGKSTTGLSVLKLIPNPPGIITSGSIRLGNTDIMKATEKQMHRIRGKEVSMIFQDPMTSLNPVIPVGEQIQEAIAFHNRMSKEESWEKAMQMLEMVGITRERGMEYPHQFSGGMKQRIVIAIALACEPALLIADEPTTALDVTIQAQVLDMMRSLREKYQMSMMMITHDLGIVAEMCDMVSVVYAGRVVEHGTLREVFKKTRHPYTEGLFNSLPDMDNPKAELKPIPGLMPDPTLKPEGCTFAPRCKYATEKCFQKKPTRLFESKTHYVECHLYDENTVISGGKIER